MQAIKAIVIGMGLLILIGLGILAYGLVSKFGASTGRGDGVPAFGTVRAALPPGAAVADIQMRDGAVMVHLTMPDGGAQVMVFRLSDGRQTGTIELQPPR